MNHLLRILTRSLALLICACAVPAWAADDALLEARVQALDGANFPAKMAAARELAALGDPRATAPLEAMREGRLYVRRDDGRVVIAVEHRGRFTLTDAATGEELGSAAPADIARITVHNPLRNLLSALIARVHLAHEDPAMRLAAARGLLGGVNAANVDALEAVMAEEHHADVRAALAAAVALHRLEGADLAERLAALEVLAGSLEPRVRGRIASLADADEPELREAARAALASIEQKIKFYGFLQTLFFGLSMGSVLVLAAIGLAITFGVMRVINMAHGELIMIGAYTTYVAQLLMPNHIGWSLAVAVPAAFVVAGLVGIAIERSVIRFLYGRPLETLLATFGISLILQQLARSIFSPLNRTVVTPEWMSGTWQINPVLAITYNRLYILLFALAVFAALLVFLRRSRFGLQMRAVTQNRAMAKAVGVRTGWVDALTFGLGSGIAGVAGVALSQLTNVGPNLGQAYIIDSFLVVVFGGVGNLWGTLVAGLSLGVINQFLEPWAGAVMAKIVVLVFIILFIQRRPRGLFPQKGRAAEA